MEKIGDNRRVAKNTLFLYFRTIITTLISLYTTRVVLDVLGVEDYGIYSVVGSFVLTFNFIGSNLQVVSQRFLSYELGKEGKNVKRVFSSVLTLHGLISLALLFIILVAGSFYVYDFLVVDEVRRETAFFAFVFSTLGFVLNIVFTPYNAALIAYERMTIFAYLGILEAVLKLVICYLLGISNLDKLLTYSLLLLLSNLVVRLINWLYCYIKIKETRGGFTKNIKAFKEMGAFFGWNGLGSIAVMLREQGIAMLYNYFFGPIVNAARAIASQIQNVTYSFVGNFGMALNPQITKLCAAKEYNKMNTLVMRGSRFSFFLMLVLSVPLSLNINQILELWLIEVPQMANIFAILSLVFFTLKALQSPISAAILATGKVRKYNICWGGLNLLIFPISWILFKFGLDSTTSYYVCIVVTFVVLFSMLQLYRELFGFSVSFYIKGTLIPCFIVTFISIIFSMLIGGMVLLDSYVMVLLRLFLQFTATAISIFFGGLSKIERNVIYEMAHTKLKMN